MASSNTDIAQILVNAVANNPDLLSTFLEHPYTAVQEATGADEKLDKEDMSEVVTAAAGYASGQSFDTSMISGLASALLGSNDNSVHTLVGSLFGGADTSAAGAAASDTNQASAGLDLGSLVNLAGAATSLTGGKSTGIDLSDGIGLDDLAGILGLMGGASASGSSASAQQSSGGFLQVIINLFKNLFGMGSDK